MDEPARRLRRMEAGVQGTPLRLLRAELRVDRAAQRNSMAVPGGGDGTKNNSSLRKWKVRDRRWQGKAVVGRVQSLPGTTRPRVPIRAEHGAHRRALAHPYQNGAGPDSSADVAHGVAGDEYARCADPAIEASRSRRCGLAAWARQKCRVTGDRDRGARPGVHAIPFLGDERESGDAKRIRPDLARAQLQTMRGRGSLKPYAQR